MNTKAGWEKIMKVEDYSDMEKEKKNVDVCNFFVLTIMCLHTIGEFKEFYNFQWCHQNMFLNAFERYFNIP